MVIDIYKSRYKVFSLKTEALKKRLVWLSFARFISFLLVVLLIYMATQTSAALVIVAAVLCFVAFLVLVNRYGRQQQQRRFYEALSEWNKKEAIFLETNQSDYDAGKSYEDRQHPYSYDLDLFSEGGLFAYINRCSTSFGRRQLADDLLRPDVSSIRQRQEAIRELSGKIDFRQRLYAHGSLHQSKKRDLEKLFLWIDSDTVLIKKWLYYVLMIFPLSTLGALVFFIVTEQNEALNLVYKLFVLNLIIAGAFGKKISAQLSVSTSVSKILQNYSKQLRLIEEEDFTSPLLKQLQQQLAAKEKPASFLIGQLAGLFNYLESVINLAVSLFLNGFFLFHVHILFRLGRWKQQHAPKIKEWLQLIGRVEALGSFANLSYNNSSFCMPEMAAQPFFQVEGLGHILVRPDKRVTNDVSFNQQKFVILTGSNMSGKSTFLRTLGTNLILAKAGSVVCATTFGFYPFDIFVSMRITDSLQDDESLFYAELKRLQAIIESLKSGKHSFIILDEILRGTNSNDKRNGTIGLIRKMKTFDTFGIIATHDIVVAQLIEEYPRFIGNRSFESTIVNDELLFDYKLKGGVCNSLSASYLMKKMEII
ncbi:MutS-related protein [Niabella insulamsoli]|uniref:MutS-related protein n=1 Tax=Niabella insulamsoli TaxID=3144874 RepID=UPI0031FC80B3